MNQYSNQVEKQNWLQLASVQIGGAICLPLILVGYELARINTPLAALSSILWGNILLFSLSLIAGWLSINKPRATAENASDYFGNYGKIFFAFTIAVSMLGWFAIQAQCMGSNFYHLITQIPDINLKDQSSWMLIFSGLLAACTIAGAFFGVNMLTRIANFCIPAMIFTIGCIIFLIGGGIFILPSLLNPSFFLLWNGQSVSLVLASNMAATIDLPTFYRHARNFRDTFWSSFVTYLIAIPIIQYAGVCLYYGTHANTLDEALISIPSLLWKNWLIIFMLLAGWTTNNLNLYSASNSIRILFRNFSFPQAVGVAGLIGIIFITIPVLDRFVSILDLMGVFIVGMGGVMLTAFVFEFYGIAPNPKLSWFAWSCSIGFGLIEMKFTQFSGTGAIVLDAGLIASLIVILANAPQLIRNLQSSDLSPMGETN